MLPPGLLLFLCTAGILQPILVTGGIFDFASRVLSNGKSFYRVDDELSWREAMNYCRDHYTDLANLQSMSSMRSLLSIASLITHTQAWIGLFFDMSILGPRWSTGPAFTNLDWIKLPILRDGMCVTLHFMTYYPALGVDSCTAQKPFICYKDPEVNQRISMEPSLGLIIPPKQTEVQIRGYTFMRFEQAMTWTSALKYCRSHYTDLADLQMVTDEADQKALKSITNETEAWIGLYFNADTRSLDWSSGLGATIPSWLLVPQFERGLCAGLRAYSQYHPQVYTVVCSSLQPFICFYDPSIRHGKLTEMPQLLSASSFHVAEGTTPRPSTGTSFSHGGALQGLVTMEWPQQPGNLQPTTHDPGTRDPYAPTLAGPMMPRGTDLPSPLANPTPLPVTSVPQEELNILLVTAQSTSSNFVPLSLTLTGPAYPERPSVLQEVARTPLVTTASTPSDPMPLGDSVTPSRLVTQQEVTEGPSPASTGHAPSAPTSADPPGSSTSTWSHGSKPLGSSPGPEERTSAATVSGNPAESQRTTAPPASAAPSQAALMDTAATSVEGGNERRHTVTASQVQHLSSSNNSESEEKTSAPKSGAYSFGILKADFAISTLIDPEEMKDQFLSEIQEVLKFTLGHEQFQLKWVGLEVNKEQHKPAD